MPINVVYYYNGYFPHFTCEGDLTSEDVDKLITALNNLLTKDPFLFLLDGRNVKNVPVMKLSYQILNWMIYNRHTIPKKIIASCVIIDNPTIKNILDWVFERKKPMNPNLITDNYEQGMEFIREYMPEEKIKKRSKII